MPFAPRTATAQRWTTLLVISAVGGLLLAGMLLPVVGGLGLIARAGANDFEALPANLRISALPQASRILAADGSTIAKFYFQDRETVALSAVPDVMQKAIIAVEDVRFYEHHGIDWVGVLRAVIHNGEAGQIQQGASTLTQQYVKNVLIEKAEANGNQKKAEAARADTFARKAQEARYALALEQRYTKAQILQGYLNIAYFGDGAYGVATAARHYFGESVRDLTLPQASLLAGLVQSPEAYDPAVHPHLAKERRGTVLGQMLKYDFISQAQYDHAMKTPVKLDLTKQGSGCEASKYPYFCDYVQHVIEHSPEFGKHKYQRDQLLRQGGLTIQTTLDPDVQDAADTAMHDYVHPNEPTGVSGAEAVVQPGTGKVLALTVSRDYGQGKGETNIDYAVDQKYGGGTGYSVGSTFKLFILAAAMKEGIPLETNINAPPKLTNLGPYSGCPAAGTQYEEINNAEPTEGGTFNLLTGTWESVNTFYAQLEQRTGLCTPAKLAASMGVQQATGQPIQQVPSMVLGANPAGYSALDMANAYATIAAHGQYCKPVAITRVTTQEGKSIAVPAPHCEQVLAPDLADSIAVILHGVLTEAHATAYGLSPGRPAAAKTGTAENNKASNFAGFVPQMSSFVWVGNPDSPNDTLNHLTIGGRTYGEVFGATIAGPIWQETLRLALEGKPVIPLPHQISPIYLHGEQTRVPDVSGLTVHSAEGVLKDAGFHPVVGNEIDSVFPQGTVAATTPSAGSEAPAKSTVTLLISNGHAPKPTPAPQPSSTGPGPGGGGGGGGGGPGPTPQPTCTKQHGNCPHV